MTTDINKRRLFFWLLPVLPIYLALAPAGHAALPLYANGQALPSLAPMLERSMPAVVNISTSTNIQVNDNPLLQDPFFRHFYNLPN